MEKYSGLAIIELSISNEARRKLADLRQRVVADNPKKQVVEYINLDRVERDILVDALKNVWEKISWWIFGDTEVESDFIHEFLMESASSWLSYQGYKVWEKLTNDARSEVLKFVFPKRTKTVEPT